MTVHPEGGPKSVATLTMPLPIGVTRWPAPCFITIDAETLTVAGLQMATHFYRCVLEKAIDAISGVKVIEGSWRGRFGSDPTGETEGVLVLVECLVERVLIPAPKLILATSMAQAINAAKLPARPEYAPIQYKKDMS